MHLVGHGHRWQAVVKCTRHHKRTKKPKAKKNPYRVAAFVGGASQPGVGEEERARDLLEEPGKLLVRVVRPAPDRGLLDVEHAQTLVAVAVAPPSSSFRAPSSLFSLLPSRGHRGEKHGHTVA